MSNQDRRLVYITYRKHKINGVEHRKVLDIVEDRGSGNFRTRRVYAELFGYNENRLSSVPKHALEGMKFE